MRRANRNVNPESLNANPPPEERDRERETGGG